MGPEPITTLAILFWSALAVLCYSYVGYPVLIFLMARYFPAKNHKSATACQVELPELTVLIVACNAEHHICERIKNVLAGDYPPDRVQVLVASDGSTDNMVQLVENFGDPRVRVLAFSQRRGKTQTLVEAIQHVDSDIILFTDATNRFDRDSIRHLARHFIDPHIGIATGKVSLIDECGQPVESAYWSLEMMLRRSEMRLGIMLGANGPIYAIRRHLFVEPKRPVINDDFVLPMLTHLRHGCGIVFDDSARAFMLSSGGLPGEFRRRCRIGAGAFQSLPVLQELFQWRHAKQAVAFASHKLIRWIGPFLLAIVFATSLSFVSLPGYRLLFWVQAAAYLLAVSGLFMPKHVYATRLARVATSFLVMNLALLTGFFRWVADPHKVVWNPTVRPVLNQVPTLQSELH